MFPNISHKPTKTSLYMQYCKRITQFWLKICKKYFEYKPTNWDETVHTTLKKSVESQKI